MFIDGLPVKIEYEPKKPKLLKRADGSLISEPQKGAELVAIFTYCQSSENFPFLYKITSTFNFRFIDRPKLYKGLIFLREDTHLAEKKANQLTKQFEIQNEIDRLNAENGEYIVEDREFAFKINEHTDKVEIYQFYQITIPEKWKMRYDTAKTILAKYSQDELKQYLEKII